MGVTLALCHIDFKITRDSYGAATNHWSSKGQCAGCLRGYSYGMYPLPTKQRSVELWRSCQFYGNGTINILWFCLVCG